MRIAPQWSGAGHSLQTSTSSDDEMPSLRLSGGLRNVAPDALFCYYEARQLGLSDAASVSSWPDLSGRGNNLSQGTAANQPTFRSTGLSSKAAVEFNGSDNFLSGSFGDELNSGSGSVQESTWLMTMSVGSPSDNHYFMGAGNSGNDTPFYYFKGKQSDYAHIINGTDVQPPENNITGGADVVVAVRHADWCSFRVDGNVAAEIVAADTSSHTFDQFSMGCLLRTSTGFFADPTVGIAAVWNRVLTPREIERAERYCSQSYDVALDY